MSFGTAPAMIRLKSVMRVVDSLGAKSGSADARDPSRIVVSFPSGGLGHPATIAQSACRAFQDAGFHPGFMNVNDRTATFHLADMAA